MILVTGGCGYIGSHIVKLLSEAGEKVIVFDNLSSGRTEALLHGEPLIQGDITDQLALDKVFTHVAIDTVIHTAALVNAAESVDKAAQYFAVNVQGTKNVWRAAQAAGVQHILFASSAAVYGIPATRDALTEQAVLAPTNPYGTSKVEGEVALTSMCTGTQTNYGIFRFFNVAGAEYEARLFQDPHNHAILTRLFAAAAGKTASIEISGADYPTPDGSVIRDFIHVEDIAAAHLLGVHHLRSGKPSFICNLGTGIPTSLKELVDIVAQVTQKKIIVTYGPRKVGDISYSVANASSAKEILGWQAKKTLTELVVSSWRAYRAHS